MADDVTDQVYAFNAPTGWKLDTPGANDVVFTVSDLTYADDHRLALARQYFVEVREQDYDRDGRDWVNSATGERLRQVRFDPSLSQNPAETGVTGFFQTHEGRLLYLRPVGSVGRSQTVVQGTVGEVAAR